MRSPRWAALLLVIAGCRFGPQSSVLISEETNPTRVLAFRSGAGTPYSFAASSIDQPLRLFAPGYPLEVVELGYAQTLLELGLQPGALPDDGSSRSCILLAPADARLASVDSAADNPPWQPLAVSDLASDLLSALVPDAPMRCNKDSTCASLSAARIDLHFPNAPDSQVAFAVADPPNGALVGVIDGNLWRVALNGSPELLCGGSTAAFARVVAGARGGGASLVWLGTAEGSLLKLWPARQVRGAPCVVETSSLSPSVGELVAIAVAPAGEPFELFVTGDSADLGCPGCRIFQTARFDGTGWTDSGRFEFHHGVTRDASGLVRLGPGRALATTSASIAVSIEAGTVQPASYQTDDGRQLAIEAPGAWRSSGIVGVRNTGLAKFEPPDRFTLLHSVPEIVIDINSVMGFGSRVFFGVDKALIEQYVDGHSSLCPQADTPFDALGSSWRAGVPLDATHFLVGELAPKEKGLTHLSYIVTIHP